MWLSWTTSDSWRDPALYEKLALVDDLRDGRTREPNWPNKNSKNSCARKSMANQNLELLIIAAKL
jgi:hypothetical protein